MPLSCALSFLAICALCLVNIDLTLLMHAAITYFYCISVEDLMQLVVRWKVLVNKVKKLRPILLLTFMLNGGLNQMISRCLCLRACCGTC